MHVKELLRKENSILKDCRLLIIDSLGAICRRLYFDQSSSDVDIPPAVRRMKYLSALISELKKIAERHQLVVRRTTVYFGVHQAKPCK